MLQTGLGGGGGGDHGGRPGCPPPPSPPPCSLRALPQQPLQEDPGPLMTGHVWIHCPCQGHWVSWGGPGGKRSFSGLHSQEVLDLFPCLVSGFCFVTLISVYHSNYYNFLQ